MQALKLIACGLQQATCRLVLLADQKTGSEGLGPSIGLWSSQSGLRGYFPVAIKSFNAPNAD